MPPPSDSGLTAATRLRRPYSTSGRPPVLDIIDDAFVKERLADDLDIPGIARLEAAVAPLLDDGELDSDAIVISASGNSSAAAQSASERRRREDEGWNDLGLDLLMPQQRLATSTNHNNNTNNNQQSSTSS